MALINVMTTYGRVEGLACNNHNISVFKGIPYAMPPVGELRWSPPQPPAPWSGLLQAHTYRAMPVQVAEGEDALNLGTGIWPVSEDCLYLNVWTPAKRAEEGLPVLVWVYGGAYKTGSATNCLVDGGGFAKQGCVVVSFNYRVGPLGYLAHPELSAESDRGVSGNYGTLDQIAALNWVHDNIAAFGGDPEMVTLIGQSAGAHSVMTLCNSPLASSLMHRAIIQSTAGLSAMYYQDEQTLADAQTEGALLLDRLGIRTVAQARQMDGLALTKRLINEKISTKAPWFPKTDGYVLPLGTISSIMAGKQAKIPYLCGCNSYETGNMEGFLSDDKARITAFANMCFPADVDGYLKTVDAYDAPSVIKAVFEQYNSDKLCALLGWQELELLRGNDCFYQYYFTKDQPGPDGHGACHGAELPYVFGTMETDRRSYDGSDFDLSVRMRAYWTNFIKTGDPNGEGLPRWEKYGENNRKVMELGEHVGMIPAPLNEHRRFIVDYMLRQAKAAVRGLSGGNL